MKYTKIIAVASIALAVASCTEYSDYNTAPEESGMGSKTLWQNISENSSLSKFAEIVEKAGFKSNLDAPTFYTLFAPLNGTYNADSVLQILASGEEADTAQVIKEFIKQHIVEYNHPVNGALEESKLLSLNAKAHIFSQTGYGDAKFTSNINLPASNGLMHIMNGKEGFYTNIYEYLDKIEGCDLFREYVKEYDEQYIDESNSVLGPIMNGTQTYEYIEYKHRNTVVNNTLRAQLENEDSSYTMLFPNDEAWQKSYDRIKGDFNYLEKVSYNNMAKVSPVGASMKTSDGKEDISIGSSDYIEFLSDSLTKKMMISNLAFSHGYPSNDILLTGGGTVEDSVYSTRKNLLVSAKDIEDHTVETYRMSNGFVRMVDSIPYQPWQTFEPIINTKGVARCTAGTSEVALLSLSDLKSKFVRGAERDTIFKYVPDYFYDGLIGDKSSDSRYFTYVSTTCGQSAVPELDFALSGALSTTYHLYVLTLPNQMLDNPEEGVITKQKPYYLSFYLNYTDASNTIQKKQLYLSDDADASWGPKMVTESKVKHIVTEPGYAQVIDLGEVTFPVCYYGLDAYPSLMMCHTQKFNTSTKRNSYEHELRVAGVYLVPVEANDYFIKKSENDDK